MELPEGAEIKTRHLRFEQALVKDMDDVNKFRENTAKARDYLRSLKPAGMFKGPDRIGEPSPRGGCTIVEITLPDGTKFEGRSICCFRDNFNRKIGRQIALGRAIKFWRLRERVASPVGITS